MAVVNPVQYGIAPTPVDLGQFARGMAIGGTITDAADVMKQREAAAQKQRMDMAQQAAMRAELAALEQAPSSERARSILLRYPGLKEQVSGFMTSLNEDEKKTRLSQMTEATGFLTSGDVKGAKDAFLRSAQAYENAGRQQDADALKRLAEQVEANPNAVRAQLQLRIEAIDPEAGKRLTEFEKSRGDIAKTGAEADRTAAEAAIKAQQAMVETDRLAAEIGLTQEQAKRLKAQTAIESARLGLDRERLALDKLKAQQEAREKVMNLPEPAQKRVFDATDKATTAKAVAAKAGSLALQFDAYAKSKSRLGGGIMSSANELWRTVAGTEDALTQARQQFDALVAQNVVSSLPPGAASDKDIEMVKKGFPSGTGNPEVVASFLRGVEKTAMFDEQMKRAEADFVSQNGGVGMARTNMVVNGVQVPAGATYGEFLEAAQRKALANITAPERQRQAAADRNNYLGSITQ